MKVNLFNFSKWPDKELRLLLEHAAKEAGCEGPVVTKIHRGGRRSHGLAERFWFIYAWALSNKRGRPDNRPQNLADAMRPQKGVRTNGGWVQIWPRTTGDPLLCVEDFYRTAVHEFAHVADMQQRKRFGEYNRQWANRPHERRAITAAMFGSLKRDTKRDERILNLAIAIEQQK